MTMHKKLQEQMRQGVVLERDRVMRILQHIAANTKAGLDKKLMTAGEKHLADVRWRLCEGLLAAAQMKVMSGEDPNAEEAPKPLHGQDTDALGGTREDPDGGSAG